MNEAGKQVLAMLLFILLGALVMGMHGIRAAANNSLERRVGLDGCERWMLEALPGIGPKKSEILSEQLQRGEMLSWPSASQPYLDQVFLEDASASRKASQDR